MTARRGSILILVAGTAALIAALGAAFLVRMKSSAEETALASREAQARIMLLAACSYVLESARLGYDTDPETRAANHVEAFGWIDVRARPQNLTDANAIGPRDQSGTSLATTANVWPAIGGAARCPMYRWKRPPYAIAPTVAPNAIVTDPSSPDFGKPFLLNPDPQPAVGNGWPASVGPGSWAAYRDGDPTPVATSTGMSWFRVYRESAARFVVTCGAGGTDGWRSWNEVPIAERARFDDDQALFDQLLAEERRTWYRIEWSAAVTPNNYHSVDYHVGGIGDHYYLAAVNGSYGNGDTRSQMRAPNPCGTIRWVERLWTPPTDW